MAYLGSWKIDDLLVFPANTHDAATGAATDADAVPAYRVYEDETGTAILTGNMAKLDDSNTTGFYSEQITLSAANGFEKGKCYTVYIAATVDSVAGTMAHTFQIEAEVDANVVSGSVIVATNNDKTGYGLADDAITASKFDESTAFPLAAADSGATQVARTGADADTLETLSDQLDAVKTDTAATLTDTNELQTDWANGGRLDNILDARASQASVDDLPTNAELAAALAAADDAVLAAIAALNNLSAAQVNAEVVDALATDTYAEPSAVPAATATLAAKLNWLAMLARNRITQTATTQTLYADDATTARATSGVSDDGTTASRNEWTNA